MKAIWTDRLDADAKQDFILGFKHNLYLDKLRDILAKKEEELLTRLLQTPKDGSWPYEQAHLNGQLYDLRAIIDLLRKD